MICTNCDNLHKSSTVAIVGGNVVVSFSDTPTGITDTTPFCFAICQTLPSGTDGLPVVLVVNGVNVPFWNKYGDVVTGDTLVTRKLYKGYYGLQGSNPHVISVNAPIANCGC